MQAIFLLLAILAVCQATTFDLHQKQTLRPRKPAPLFKAKAVENDSFTDVSLQNYIDAGKWTVLLFYPFDYTFVCPVIIFFFFLLKLYILDSISKLIISF